jgi:hypothetical protein
MERAAPARRDGLAGVAFASEDEGLSSARSAGGSSRQPRARPRASARARARRRGCRRRTRSRGTWARDARGCRGRARSVRCRAGVRCLLLRALRRRARRGAPSSPDRVLPGRPSRRRAGRWRGSLPGRELMLSLLDLREVGRCCRADADVARRKRGRRARARRWFPGVLELVLEGGEETCNRLDAYAVALARFTGSEECVEAEARGEPVELLLSSGGTLRVDEAALNAGLDRGLERLDRDRTRDASRRRRARSSRRGSGSGSGCACGWGGCACGSGRVRVRGLLRLLDVGCRLLDGC